MWWSSMWPGTAWGSQITRTSLQSRGGWQSEGLASCGTSGRSGARAEGRGRDRGSRIEDRSGWNTTATRFRGSPSGNARGDRMRSTRVPRNIDQYIAAFPDAVQEILQKIRETIRKAAPGAE